MLIRKIFGLLAVFFSQFAIALHESVPTHFAGVGIVPPIVDRVEFDLGLEVYFYLPFGEYHFTYCNEPYCSSIESQLGLSKPITGTNVSTGFIVSGIPVGGRKHFGLSPNDIQGTGASAFDSFDSQIVYAGGIVLSPGLSIAPLVSGGTGGSAHNFHVESELSVFESGSIVELFFNNSIQINGRDHFLRQLYDGSRKVTELYVYDRVYHQNILVASNVSVPLPGAIWLLASGIFGFASIKVRNSWRLPISRVLL